MLGAALLAGGAAWADGHGVTVQNGTGETIRQIWIAPVPGGWANRLQSSLPPGASGRIGYNTGCVATVRLGFESGRTEDHPDVDACTDPRVVAGVAGVAGPSGPAIAAGPAAAAGHGGSGGGVKPAASVVVAPPPAVPPWTGKSITKRFGGLD